MPGFAAGDFSPGSLFPAELPIECDEKTCKRKKHQGEVLVRYMSEPIGGEVPGGGSHHLGGGNQGENTPSLAGIEEIAGDVPRYTRKTESRR